RRRRDFAAMEERLGLKTCRRLQPQGLRNQCALSTAVRALSCPPPNHELLPGPPVHDCGAPPSTAGKNAYKATTRAVGQSSESAVRLMRACTAPGFAAPPS